MANAKVQPVKARLFMNGRSQAVRLPKQFRFEGDEVHVHREGDRVILEPVRKRAWPRGYWQWIKQNRDALALGEVEGLAPRLEDVDLDEG